MESSVSDAYVVTVKHHLKSINYQIAEEVDEDSLPPGTLEGELSEEWTKAALRDEASDAVAAAVDVILREWKIEWPRCPDHGTLLIVCSETWVDAKHSHDVANIGSLKS